MKKLIGMLCVLALFCNTQVINASENNDLISSDTISTYELTEVEEAPQNINPIYVENEEELIELISQIEEEFSDPGITSDTTSKIENNNKMLGSTLIKNNVTLTHQATIFELSSVGGKIVSDVNYTYSYWVAPESYKTTINYHDVYETGIYGFQEITYFNKSATTNGPTISVNVRGISKVYIGISGGGAEGNLVLKTFNFDKTYKINTGL